MRRRMISQEARLRFESPECRCALSNVPIQLHSITPGSLDRTLGANITHGLYEDVWFTEDKATRIGRITPTGTDLRLLAYTPNFLGGVRMAVADVDGDGIGDIITSPGVTGGPDVRVFDRATLAVLDEFMAYDPTLTNGVFVA